MTADPIHPFWMSQYILKNDIDINRIYTGSYPNDNLEKALKLVCMPLGIEYKIEDQKIILFK